MTLTFVSNYINHHQIPFCKACYAILGEDFHFIQTEPMEQERVAMGWGLDTGSLPYVLCLYERQEICHALLRDSEVVLFGWTGREDLARERLASGKLTIRVSERIYREGQWKAVSPRGLIRKYQDHIRYRKQPVCMLCAGAYTASDFRLIGAYPGKLFQWGYFPETRRYQEGELESRKRLFESGKGVQLVWAGRFLALKHPEYVVRLADELYHHNYIFHVHMLGDGEEEPAVRREVKIRGLEACFTFYGFTEPDKVRGVMENCRIHLFTSDRLEGWGAVVNEAMNSGCAVVADVRAGSVPCLIRQGENGLFYDGSYEDFAAKVRYLLDHEEKRGRMGLAAYRTITDLWNAEHAAGELLRFCEELRRGRIVPAVQGPLSPAPRIQLRKSCKAARGFRLERKEG